VSNVPPPYYNQYTAKELSYIEYMGELTKHTNNQIEKARMR